MNGACCVWILFGCLFGVIRADISVQWLVSCDDVYIWLNSVIVYVFINEIEFLYYDI